MMPSDDNLIAFIGSQKLCSLALICLHFGIRLDSVPLYSREVKMLRMQLQRLRKAKRLQTNGQLWSVLHASSANKFD